MYEKVPKELRLRQILVRGGAAAPPRGRGKSKRGWRRPEKGEMVGGVGEEGAEEAPKKGGEGGGGGGGGREKQTNRRGGKGLFAAKTGEVVGPVKSNEGWVLLLPEGSREGDLSFDQVKLELAQEKLREERSGAQARADALAALAKAKAAPAKTLKEIFPKGDDKDEKAAKPGAEDVPRAEETGLISARGGREGAIVEGVGVSNELSKAAFSGKPEELAGPFEVSGGYVIVRLKERKQPDMAEFEKKKLELLRDAELTKWMDVLTDWTQRRCVEAKEAKHIRVSREILRYEDSVEPPPYEPCTVRRQLGG